jgi:GNAT superfamily N-acetyltransferase
VSVDRVTGQVRPAVPDDAAGIASVHVRSWHEAYTGRVPQSLLDRMDRDGRESQWRRHLSREAPPGAEPLGTTWVAVADGEVVGFATSGPGRDPDARRGDLELYAIYLLAAHQGSGLASDLLAAAIGDAPASLWVLEDNPRAHAFYAKHGFDTDGAVKDDARFGASIHEVRLVRPAR